MPQVREHLPRGEARPAASPGTARAPGRDSRAASPGKTRAAKAGTARAPGTFVAAFSGAARAEASGACFHSTPLHPPPRAEAPAPEASIGAPPRMKSAPAGPKWKLDRSKIVVAHDGDSVLKLVESILTEEGYQVICESEGIAAVVAIEREKPFLVILDVALPRIYGFEICDRLKNSPESNEIKVILLAAIYDKTRYKREPVSLYGADDYIEKHHIQDSIAKKVKRLAADGQLAPGMNFPREEEITQARSRRASSPGGAGVRDAERGDKAGSGSFVGGQSAGGGREALCQDHTLGHRAV